MAMVATPSPQFTVDRTLQARRYFNGRSDSVFPVANFPRVITQLEDPEVVQPTLGGDWIKKQGWTASRGRSVKSAIAGDGLPPTRQANPRLELTDTSSLRRCLLLQQERNTSTKRNQQRFAEKRAHNLLDEAYELALTIIESGATAANAVKEVNIAPGFD